MLASQSRERQRKALPIQRPTKPEGCSNLGYAEPGFAGLDVE